MKTENLYEPNCIRTFTGKYVNLLDPQPDTICLEDIAHGLSRQPRFGGHTAFPYSVANHTIHCAAEVPKQWIREALMHDASEAYLGDIPSPLKALLPDYKAIEERFRQVIALKYKFQYPFPEIIHKVDKEVLEWEWKNVMLKQVKGDTSPIVSKAGLLLAFSVFFTTKQ